MTAVDARIMLDVDLDRALICQSEQCEQEAVWRAVLRHVNDDTPCDMGVLCDEHKTRIDASDAHAAAQGIGLICGYHLVPAVATWERL